MRTNNEERLTLVVEPEAKIYGTNLEPINRQQAPFETYEDCHNYIPGEKRLCENCNVIERLHPVPQDIIVEYNNKLPSSHQRKISSCEHYVW